MFRATAQNASRARIMIQGSAGLINIDNKEQQMNFNNGVPFDPGYSKHTYVFSESLDSLNQILASIKQFNQKKNQFKILQSKIYKLYENSTAFYLGCLLWATFIKYGFKDEPKEILDNSFLNKKVSDEEIFFEINSLLSYYENYPKDCRYYIGKPSSFPNEWLEVLETYKDFLRVNQNFENTKYTSDIKLPEKIKEPSKENLEIIFEKIESVTNSGNLEELFEIKGLIL